MKQKRDTMTAPWESERMINVGADTTKAREADASSVSLADGRVERTQLCLLSSPLSSVLPCPLPYHHLTGSGVTRLSYLADLSFSVSL